MNTQYEKTKPKENKEAKTKPKDNKEAENVVKDILNDLIGTIPKQEELKRSVNI